MIKAPIITLDQTEVSSVIKGGLWVSSGQLFNSIAAFLLTLLLSNFLLPEDFGTFKYVLSVALIINVLTLNGMNTAITQSVARGFEGSFLKALTVQLRWGVIALLVSIIVGLWHWQQGRPDLAFFIVLAGLVYPVTTSANTYKAVFLGRQSFRMFAFLSTVNTAFTLVAVILVAIVSQSVGGIIVIYLLSSCVINLLLLYITLRFAKLNAKEDKQLISYGRHLSLIAGIASISYNIDSIIIYNYFGATTLALYVLILAIPEQIRNFLRVVPAIALTKFSRLAKSKLIRAADYSILVYSLFLVFITLLYLGFAPSFFRWLFPKYLGALDYLNISAFLIFGALSDLPESVLSSVKAVKQIYIAGISKPVLQILLILSLGIGFGVTGMIVARLISFTFGFAYQYVLLRQKVASEKISRRGQPV